MTQGLLYLFVSYFIAVALVPFVIRIASRKGWLDRPDFRKVHLTPVPRLGGLAVFIALWSSWGLFCLRHPNSLPYESGRPFSALFVGSFLVWILGIYDDLRGANAWQKLSVQLIAAAIVVAGGVRIELLHNPLGNEYILTSPVLIWGLSMAWIVFITNSINLIDGLDGLATGVCFITALSLFFISRDLGSPHLPFFATAIAGSCLGFLMYNFSPARIFLGDSGSLVLGFTLAALSIMGTAKRSTAIVMFGPPIILALPAADALLAMGRRFFRGGHRLPELMNPRLTLARIKEVVQADQEHIHHALLQVGLSHRGAVMILYCVTLVLGVTAYGNALKDHLTSTAVVFAVLALALMWLRRKVRRTKLKAHGEV